ncbi:hypothetical protein BDQ17DRAFT_1330519 [Cyathus striatus]|nr:hypothetical protein BDQ17DRAFT_1330519 [Cyathus striatus]
MDEPANILQMFRLMRYTQTISTFITLYDHVCTLDAEGKRWSSSKILFIATRYIGDLDVLFAWYCAFMLRPESQNLYGLLIMFFITFLNPLQCFSCSIAYNMVITGATCSLLYLCQEISGTIALAVIRLKNSYVCD